MKKMQHFDVTRVACDNKTEHQRSKVEVLPTTKEINNLISLLKSEVDEAFTAAEKSLTYSSYRRLMCAVLMFIMVFNRKRPGDCQNTFVIEYKNMVGYTTQECLSNLNEKQKGYAENLPRFLT